MGMAASQARFLQLTARKSNVEYQAQRINFERLQIAEKMTQASNEYNDAIMNRKLVFSYNDGNGIESVDITYQNYKNYMNQQATDISNAYSKLYLVSSSGKKIVVGSEADRDKMIEDSTSRYSMSEIQAAKEAYQKASSDGSTKLSDYQKKLAAIDLDDTNSYETEIVKDENGNDVEYYVSSKFKTSDFLIAEDLDNSDNFQNAILNGVYYFATLETDPETGGNKFNAQSWESILGGSIKQVRDTADDKEAESKYQRLQNQLELQDKKYEMQLNDLETERDALQTELDAVQKVKDDNIEQTFKTFG